MKKWLALLLAVVMVLSMAPMVMAEEKPVLTWLMTGDNNVNEETEVLTELEKRLNMDINIIYINGRDFETKINTMIAGDELPDIFAGKGQTVVDLAEGGKLLDLAPYLPEYGKDILAAYPEGYLNTLPLNKDGKIYGLTVQAPPTPPISTCARTGWTTWVWLCPPRWTSSTRCLRPSPSTIPTRTA